MEEWCWHSSTRLGAKSLIDWGFDLLCVAGFAACVELLWATSPSIKDDHFAIFSISFALRLVDLLEATNPSIDDDHRAINTQLRAAMNKVDSSGADASVEALMNALSLATQ
eukprot:scaffold69674_cov21-Tisochrysis_lutea.AAC.1